MGQCYSLQSTQVIDVKKQALATDSLDTAVWYYIPESGRNIWGNRAALKLYGLSVEAFCAEQKLAWQDALGTAAGTAWQTNNDCLIHELASPEDDWSKPICVSIMDSGRTGTGIPGDQVVHAGMLPLPRGVLQLSARATPCTILHRKQQSRAYQIHVTAAQGYHARPEMGPLATTISGVAKLQLHGAQPYDEQSKLIPAGTLQPQLSSISSDGVMLAIPECSAQIVTQATPSHCIARASMPFVAHHSRLGVSTHSSSHTCPLPSIILRPPSRSLDYSGPRALPARAVALSLRRGQTASSCGSSHCGSKGVSRGTTADNVVDGAPGYSLHLPGALSRASISSGMWQKPEERLHGQQRLMEMCDNHAMFQFLFDAEGQLLTANKQALNNLREHLGEHDTYTFSQYLSTGQCDGGLSAEELFDVIRDAIIVHQEPCFRLPQLRWSKRRPGKCRWVLYEVWPMEDPVTGQPALLVTEQNITQVKAVEEEYGNQMQHLETQLEDAIRHQRQAEEAAEKATTAAAEAASNSAAARQSAAPVFNYQSAAERTLQLLDKLLNGEFVSIDEAEALRSAIADNSNTLHSPISLDEQVLQHTQAYEPAVGASLLQMLSTRAPWDIGKDPLAEEVESDDSTSESGSRLPTEQLSRHASGEGAPPHQFSQRSDGRLSQVASADAAASIPNAAAAPPTAGEMTAVPLNSSSDRPRSTTVTSVSAYPPVSDRSPRTPSATNTMMTKGSNFRAGALCGRGAVAAAARNVISWVSTPTTELDSILAKVDDWQFDTFALSAATSGHPLSTLGFFLLQRSGVVKQLSLNEVRLARWLVRVEDGYTQSNPYHNKVHAADVLRSAHVLLTMGGCSGVQSPDALTHLAVYLAAVVHDYGHRGVTNDFLVRTGDALALLYNDRSPHENHHLAASWGLLIEYNFLRSLPVASKEKLRRMMIEMVLATDMKQHFVIHGLLQSKLHLLVAAGHLPARSGPAGVDSPSCAGSSALSSEATGGTDRSPPMLSARNSREQVFGPGAIAASAAPAAVQAASTPSLEGAADDSKVAGTPQGRTSDNGTTAVLPPAVAAYKRVRRTSSVIKRGGAAGEPLVLEEDAETQSLYLQVCLKAADLGHLTAAPPVHRKWVEALEEEYFKQGDREKAAGLTVSPLMDRTLAGITKSQVGFFDIVVLPLFSSITQRFPNAAPMLVGVMDNYNMWKETEVPASTAQ